MNRLETPAMARGSTSLPALKPGDKVRFVSPASPPQRGTVLRAAAVLEGWGLRVDFGEHAFRTHHFLAGTDAERLADLDAAIRDPEVRAIFATRGGKGSYRIADRLDFAALARDPKLLVGFSDVTALHLAILSRCGVAGLHGALRFDHEGRLDEEGAASLKPVLMTQDDIVVAARPSEGSYGLTTAGSATGPLIGGNLDMIATCAGWALPPLTGCILFIEAVGPYLGHVDRLLTMLRKGGHLGSLSGIALGQFTDFEPSRGLTIVDLLRDHLATVGVPVLGGLPVGHGVPSLGLPMGWVCELDADGGRLTVQRGLP